MNRDRFKDAPWFYMAQRCNVIVGGAGGISSWLVLFLSRMGTKSFVFDHDCYSDINMAGQLVMMKQIGMPKVEALKETVELFTGSSLMVKGICDKFTDSSLAGEFMMSGFDNMEARRAMFDVWFRANKMRPSSILIDGRLLFEQIQIFCVTPANAEEYQKEYLFKDEEVEDASCTMRQTSHTAALTASLMVSMFTNHLTNIQYDKQIRSVPLKYEFFTPILLQS